MARTSSTGNGPGTVRVRFTDGPADGTLRDLPSGPDGIPPARWILTGGGPLGAGPEHLYERGPRPEAGAPWPMRWVRTDPVGMTE
ncbi:hypothetical protein [Micromonospora sp. HM5-17]|uniref:hypothetical protein n=1 Tax=Micromonospora sp. HM5-17 TaxID=2487710 RepID=UPI000F498613|nr:hypothetical protein [Micromonospora sp. HM5-17]ROT32846.1 hypothetical protein EF879_06585 [Micromonospora sp. HM5-17]